jgi:hypothetical protein
MRPLYPRLVTLPLEQVVPAATACQTTSPLLHKPNWSVPLQTIAPFSVQVPVDPPAEGVEGAEVGAAAEPVPAGTVAEGALGVPVTVTSVVEVEAIGATEGTSAAALEVTAGVLEAPGAKTPPPLEGIPEATGAADVGAWY